MRIGSLIAKGIATFEVGSAGAPSITFSGSTTAGFFAPSAGQVAISAGSGVNVFEIEGGGTPGKITFTTGYDALLPAAGAVGDDNAAVTKKWTEDNFVIGDITTLGLNDLSDVDVTQSTGPNSGDYMGYTGAQWENRNEAQVKGDLNLEIGTDIQAWDQNLDQIAGLTPTTDNFIVGDGAGTAWEAKTPAQARTSLGLFSGGAGDIWVDVAGDSMNTGADLSFSGGGEVLGLPSLPSVSTAAASKAYVDSLSAGLTWLDPVYYIDWIEDAFAVDVTKDLQTPANDTTTKITQIEDSDMVIIGSGPSSQGLDWTAVGVTGNTVVTSNLMAGDVLRWNSDSQNGNVDPFWERVQLDDGGSHLTASIFQDELKIGVHNSQCRWGTQIDTQAPLTGGTLFSFDGSIVDLTIDDLNQDGDVVRFRTTGTSATTTDTADGANATGFTFLTEQQGTGSLPEISKVTCNVAASLNNTGAADYWTFSNAGNTNNYYVWYNVSGGTNTDPAPGGTGIQVDVRAADDAISVAAKTRGAIAGSVAGLNKSNADVDMDTHYDVLWGFGAGMGTFNVSTISVEVQLNIGDSNYFYVYASCQAPQNVTQVTLTDTGVANQTDAAKGTTTFRITKITDGDGGSVPEQTLVETDCSRRLTSTGAGDYFTFSANGTAYYAWYNFTDGSNSDPAPGGTGIQIDITTDFCAGSVGLATRDAINTAASANVTATTTAQWMRGDESQAGGIRFHVWFDKSGSAVDPAPIDSYEGIEVDISGDTSANDVANSIITALNAHRPQQSGVNIGKSVMWDATVSGDDVVLTDRHTGRGTIAGAGTGTSGGLWGYTETTQGTYDQANTADAFYVANPDSFNFGNQYTWTGSEWTLFGGSSAIIAGKGLSQDGQFMNVNFGPGILENPSDQVGVELYTTTSGAIILTTDGTSREENDNDSAIHLLLDGTGTGNLSQGANGLKVATSGISETEIATSVAGLGLVGGAGSALDVNPGQAIKITGDLVEVDFNATFFQITGVTPNGVLDLVNSSITAAKLADDYVDVTGDTMTGNLTMGSGTQIFGAGDGTKTNPGISVAGDTDSGLFSVGINQLGVSAGDTLVTTFATTNIINTVPTHNPLGSAGAPSVTFTGDIDTGIFSSGANTIDFATGTTNRFKISSNGLMTTGDTTAGAYATLVSSGGGESIPNKQWVADQLGSLSTTTIIDADADTKVSVEESGDDDTIRMDTGQTPAGYGAVADIFVLNSAGWTVGMGTANVATTVGAPISVTAGVGNTSGAGGAVSITSGQGGTTANGGAISLTGGAGGVTTGAGGAATLQGGDATGVGAGGDANVYAGNGNSVGGSVNASAGDSSGSDTGGTVSINGGTGGATGDGGSMVFTAGDAGVTSGDGGYTLIYGGGASGPSGTGGYVALYGGPGSSATGVGGEAKVTAGSGGTGYGGDAIIQSGAGGSGAGKVDIIGGASTSGDGGDINIGGGNGSAGSSLGGTVTITAGDASSNIGGNVILDAGAGSSSANNGYFRSLAQYHEFLTKSTTTGGELRLIEGSGNGTGFIGHKAPDAITATVTYEWPEAPAVDGYALVSTTGGVMSWIDIAGSLDNSKITDGDATTAETYIDTNESANQITSQVGTVGNITEFQPFFARGSDGRVAITAGSSTNGTTYGGNVAITAGSGYGTGYSGDVLINAGVGTGAGTTRGGHITLKAGDSSRGGNVNINGGDGTFGSSIGYIAIRSGAKASYMGVGSTPELYMGAIGGQAIGEVTLSGGSGTGSSQIGGPVTVKAGSGNGVGAAGDLNLTAGDSTSGTAGNVVITAGDGAAAGYIELGTTDTATAVGVRYLEASTNGTNYIALAAPNGITTNRTWVLPQTAPVNNYVLITDGGGNLSFVDPGTLATSSIAFGDLTDIIDTVPQTNQVVSVLVGNSTEKETQSLIAGTNLTAVVDQGADTVTLNVDDSFIANNGGDSFGDSSSGVWTIVSGSRIDAATGATIRMADLPTTGTDVANKSYVDSIAAGLDPKESVIVGTTADLTGVTWGSPSYNYTAGTGGTGAFVDINLSVAIDGVTLSINDRVLVKDQSNARQNGIYVAKTGTSWPTQALLERSEDQDGSPASEVSGGNFTFIESGTTFADTGWVLTGQGVLSLSTNGSDGDNLIWTQFTGAGSFTAGLGLSQSGNTLDLDIDDLTTSTIVSTDVIAFHDADAGAEASGSKSRKLTASSFIADLGLLTTSGTGGSLGGTDGVLFNTTTNNVELDITNLGAATIVGADELVFDDGASGNHAKITASNFLTDLNITNRAYTSSGLMTHSADDTWNSVTLTASGTASEEGIIVDVASYTSGITIGLDINGLSPGGTPSGTDKLVLFDGTNNVSASVTDLGSAISGVTNIGDLGDVEADSSVDAAGNMLVADGTNSYDTKKIQHIDTVAAQTSVAVSHNIGQQFVTVQCYDTTGASPVMVIPSSVTLTNVTTTTVTFSPAFTGKIVIMGIPGVV